MKIRFSVFPVIFASEEKITNTHITRRKMEKSFKASKNWIFKLLILWKDKHLRTFLLINIYLHLLSEFRTYMNATNNTISGRHPISILLQIIDKSSFKRKGEIATKLIKYG